MDYNFHIKIASTDEGISADIMGSPLSLAVGVSILITDISERSNIDVNTFMGAVKEIMCKTTRIDLNGYKGMRFNEDD